MKKINTQKISKHRVKATAVKLIFLWIAFGLGLPIVAIADAVTWYDFDSDLSCEPILAACSGGSFNSKLYKLASCESRGPVIIKLSGTYANMGYAHGWMLANAISEMWQNFFRPAIENGHDDPKAFLENQICSWYSCLYIPDSVKEEMSGIAAGLNDRGIHFELGNPPVSFSPEARHIFAMNSYGATGYDVGKGFGRDNWWSTGICCSSFSYLTPDGRLLVGRNMDLIPDTDSDYLWHHGLVIARDPDGEPHKVVTVGWPGYIAAIDSLNDAGIGQFPHHPPPSINNFNKIHCQSNSCAQHCQLMQLSMLEGLHTQSSLESLKSHVAGQGHGLFGGICHLFDKNYAPHYAKVIETDGINSAERYRVEGDPANAIVVTSGCTKVLEPECPQQEAYSSLVNLINN